MAAAAVIPVSGSAAASSKELRPAIRPRDQAAGDGGVVAEPDPIALGLGPAVARYGEPHRGTSSDDLVGIDAHLLQGAGPRPFDHHVGIEQHVARSCRAGRVTVVPRPARIRPHSGPAHNDARFTTRGGRSSGGASPRR